MSMKIQLILQPVHLTLHKEENLIKRKNNHKKIESEFGKYYSHPGSNPVNVCFVNYDLPTKCIIRNNCLCKRYHKRLYLQV